jgi:hypothetical protein
MGGSSKVVRPYPNPLLEEREKPFAAVEDFLRNFAQVDQSAV